MYPSVINKVFKKDEVLHNTNILYLDNDNLKMQ